MANAQKKLQRQHKKTSKAAFTKLVKCIPEQLTESELALLKEHHDYQVNGHLHSFTMQDGKAVLNMQNKTFEVTEFPKA